MPALVLIAVALLCGVIAWAVARRYPHDEPGAVTARPVSDAAEESSRGHRRLQRWLRARRDPRMATGLLLTLAAAVIVGAGLLIGVLAYLVRGNDALRRIDNGAARWGREHASDASDAIVDGATQLGETWFCIVAGLLVAAYAWRRGSSRLVVPFLIVVVAGDKLLTTGIKELANRARPTLEPIAETLGPSFPSGHSSTAAAFFAGAALVLGLGRSPRTRALIAGAAVGLAVAVAASRVLLAVHWTSDVVAGLALGWAWFALCAVAFGGRLLRFGATAERVQRRARAAPDVSRGSEVSERARQGTPGPR
jgi:membrane-associated phospholipid phosphatase